MSDLGIILNKKYSNDEKGKESSLQLNDAFGTTNTRLYDFLSKTSFETAADIVDPLNTFDVEIQFSPSLFADDGTSIYGYSTYQYENSFLKNLAEKILRVGTNRDKNLFDGTLTLQMGYYVQSMTIPQMIMPEAGKVPTLFGEFPVNNLFVKPDNNTFTMSILNTKVSIHDYIFYPWMREVTMPVWSYQKQPYTNAIVTVKFDKHANLRYVFVGCRPSQISSRQPTQEPDGDAVRDITMLFDYMYITAAAQQQKLVYNLKALEDAADLFKNQEKIKDSLYL